MYTRYYLIRDSTYCTIIILNGLLGCEEVFKHVNMGNLHNNTTCDMKFNSQTITPYIYVQYFKKLFYLDDLGYQNSKQTNTPIV